MTRDPNAPDTIPPGEGSKGFGVERELDHMRGQLREGTRTMAELRTGIERLRDALAQVQREFETKLAAAQLAEKDANEAIRRSAESRAITNRGELEAKLLSETARVGVKVQELENTIAPRASSIRILGWLGAAALVLGPILGWAWVRFEALDARLRGNEAAIVEMRARLAPPVGGPP